MTRLIAALIRHGDYHQLPGTPSAHQPFPLNAAGEAQASAAVAEIRRVAAEAELGADWEIEPTIDSSCLLRSWQTADIIASGLSESSPGTLRIEEFDALAERGVGIVGNLSIAQIEEVLARDPRYTVPPAGWKADSHYRLPLPGAESLLQAGRRVATHLETRMQALQRRQSDRLKLFVGHGAAFRHAAYHLGVLEFKQIAALSMYHAQPVFLEVHPDGRWQQVAGAWKQRRPAEEYND